MLDQIKERLRAAEYATQCMAGFTADYEPEHAAKRAVRFADALIAELDKEPGR